VTETAEVAEELASFPEINRSASCVSGEAFKSTDEISITPLNNKRRPCLYISGYQTQRPKSAIWCSPWNPVFTRIYCVILQTEQIWQKWPTLLRTCHFTHPITWPVSPIFIIDGNVCNHRAENLEIDTIRNADVKLKRLPRIIIDRRQLSVMVFALR